jgi:hypothetical protein
MELIEGGSLAEVIGDRLHPRGFCTAEKVERSIGDLDGIVLLMSNQSTKETAWQRQSN